MPDDQGGAVRREGRLTHKRLHLGVFGKLHGFLGVALNEFDHNGIHWLGLFADHEYVRRLRLHVHAFALGGLLFVGFDDEFMRGGKSGGPNEAERTHPSKQHFEKHGELLVLNNTAQYCVIFFKKVLPEKMIFRQFNFYFISVCYNHLPNNSDHCSYFFKKNNTHTRRNTPVP